MTEELDDSALNALAWDLVHQLLVDLDEYDVEGVDIGGPGAVLDFGVETIGSLSAGIALAEICTSGLLEVRQGSGRLDGVCWDEISVATDHPVEACLLTQYAGWKLQVGDYFAMASGPMRAAAASESLFEQLEYREEAFGVVGVLESAAFPTPDVVAHIAEKCRVTPENVALLVAPTASLAGNLQIIARSVETAMHKLFSLGFDVRRVVAASGSAPLAPVAADDLTGIGRTNDAILYGGRVTLWVSGDDESVEEIGPRVPSSGSPAAGRTFLELFEESGRDFYKIDPHLFSPAEVVFQNIETGRVRAWGQVNETLLRKSFGF